jgi:hypothetical protein
MQTLQLNVHLISLKEIMKHTTIMKILFIEQRLARGDITKEEYETLRHALEH